MRCRLFPAFALTGLVLGSAVTLQAAELKTFPGHGTAPVEKATFGQAKKNQDGLDKAERLAVMDALSVALRTLLGARHLEPADMDALVKDLADHSSTFVRDRNVSESMVENGKAVVNLALKVDLASMKEYLETKEVSLTQAYEQKFKIFVLTYTVEGMDPDRSKPVVLHEEVRIDQKNVQSGTFSGSSSDSASLDASHSAGGGHSSSHGAGSHHAAGSVSASAQSSASVSASAYSDTSGSYFRVTDYADPTKKGAGASNDVRAKLEGAFNNAGLTVALLNLPLGGSEFKHEDEFIDKVITEVHKRAEVKPNDYVALAINSLTPVGGGGHRFTSKVTFRVVRVQDKVNLISADSVAKTSENKPSDDEARTQATNLALLSLDSVLPEQIRKGLQKLTRESATATAPASGRYTIEILNIKDRAIVAKAKQLFRQEGYKFTSETGAGGTLETIVLEMGTRSPEEVKDLLDTLPNALQVLSKDDHSARLQVK